MGIVSFITVRTVEVIVVLALILFMPSIPPKANFTPFKVSPTQELKGNLAVNDRLNGAEHIYVNQLKGAEAFAEYNGELYSSLFTGEVVKLSKGHVVPIVKFGKPCSGVYEEPICGRPLGLKFNKNGDLFVCDAYYGIWKVDVKTGEKTLIVSMDEEIEGKKPMIPNSITLSENGDFYWTDSTTEFMLEDGVFGMLADGSGRLIHYNAKTKTNKVLMDGLHFANGVHLSSDEEFLIVAETMRNRIYRFYLKGPKAGTHDIFADGLPGMPDNINSDGKDGFFVPLVIAVDKENPAIGQVIGPFPWIRKLAARILGIIELGFKTVHSLYPNMYTQMGIHTIGHFESMSFFFPDRTTILHFSKDGEIIESLHATDRSLSGTSEAFIFRDHLYLGSPFVNYIGKIPLSKVGLEHLRHKREAAAPKTTPTPVKTTEKPTTKTTEKPVTKTTEKPVTKTTEKPTTRTTEKPVIKTTEKPATTTTEKPKIKETPPPKKVQETKKDSPKIVPVKENPPKTVPVKQNPSTQKQSPPPKQTKDSPKVAPIKENVPKPRV